jgi:hypothetical protein
MNISFLNLISYSVINILLFFSWYILLFRKRNYLSFIDRLIGTSVLCLSQIILTEILLGVLFKRLFAISLLLLNIFISLVVLIISFKYTEGGLLRNVLKDFRDETIKFFKTIKGDFILLFIFCLFCISVIWIVFTGYLFPPYPWDALWYHLPIVGYIIQSGAIQEIPVSSFIDQFINILPKNIELFFLWNIIFLKSDTIVDLSQLLFTLIGTLTVFSIALKLKLDENQALYSSLLFFFTPIIILQSKTNYIDIAVSVLFLITINFLMYDSPDKYINPDLGANLKKKIIPILLAGLSTGILLGSKASGPLFAILLSVAIAAQEFIKILRPSGNRSLRQKRDFLKESLTLYLIFFIIPAFLTGGYWYIKNWVLYNNPVYPMEVTIFNITLFKGVYGGIVEPIPEAISNLFSLSRLFYVWRERLGYYIYDSRLGGLGSIWFILFLPSLIFSLINSIKERRYGLLFINTIIIVTFLIYPRNWNPRYVIFIIGLGAISFGYILYYFKERQTAIKTVALLLVIYTFLTSNSPCITPAKVKEFFNLPPEERTISQHASFNIDLHARREYGVWSWINRNIQSGDVLAYTFEPLFLAPLWNRGYSNKVVYIKSEDFNNWIKQLRDNNVDYVLIKKDSKEDGWVKKLRGIIHDSYSWLSIRQGFKTVYYDENYKILKFE